MSFYTQIERYCDDCGYPVDQCECGTELERDAEPSEIRDEDYL